MDVHNLTLATERTILSDSNDHDSPLPILSVPAIHGLDIADVWQFVLNAHQLDRFTPSKFLPSETVYGIGEGACYRVDKCKLSYDSGRVVAVKYLKLTEQGSREVDSGESNRSIATVLRELRILTHDPIRNNANIVRLLGYGSRTVGEHLSLYLVVEFATFGTLRDYLSKEPNGTVSITEKIKFCHDIAKGLAVLHSCGVVQGDLKLENVLVFTADSGEALAKLSDFGHSILDDKSRYIGTAIFNAPEVRRGRLDSAIKTDYYKCDMFSYGLMVWEVMKDGRRYVDFRHHKEPVTWLNALPKDDILRMALLATQALAPAHVSKTLLFQKVLEYTLKDNPDDRCIIQEVLKLFDSERPFLVNDYERTMISSFDPSKLSTLERWSLYRSDSQANTIPFQLQKRVFARLQSLISSHLDSTTLGRTLFELSMCYFYGFGVEANVEKMLNLLRDAVCLKNPMAMAICYRMHEAFSQVLPSNFQMDDPILQMENELQRLPDQDCFSARIRRHEKLYQRSILNKLFDLFSDGILIAKDLSFLDLDRIQNIVIRGDINASSLVGVSSLADALDIGSLLHLAARLGQLLIVELLVRAGADVNLHWEGCGTPLTSACRGGQPTVVYFLLSNGANAGRQSGLGPSPLHWMIMFEEDQLRPVIGALQKYSVDINLFSTEVVKMREHSLRLAMSALHFATSARYPKLVEVLIEAGAATNEGVMTPLDLAVASGFPELTTILLKCKSSSGMESPLLHQGWGNALGQLLLHGSSARRMLESTVDILLKSKFSDINVKDMNGLTPLACAINDCPCEINLDHLEVLINHGACLNITSRRIVHLLGGRNDGKGGRIMKLLLDAGKVEPEPSLLTQSCLYGDEGILKSVLEFGVDINLPESEDGVSITALQSAVLIPGNFPIISALLDHGADITVKHEGRTVLELSAMSPIGDGDVIDLLIERGVDLLSTSETTILHLTARLSSKVNGSHIMFHLLRHDRARALINVPSHDDNQATPLQIACFAGNIEAISALVEARANINTTDKFNPVALVEMLGRSPELSPSWKDHDFDISKYQLIAERTLLILLDKVDPSHGRTPLHLAATIGNYERVVMLVESGADVWAADSENRTPLGHLHPESGEPNSEISDPSLKTYLGNAKKIFEYLQKKMIETAGAASSYEDVKDIFYKITEFPKEDDDPEQLEARYRELVENRRRELGENHPETLSAMSKLTESYELLGKVLEAETLELKVLEKREVVLGDSDCELFESRSNRVRILLAKQNLDEAKIFTHTTLELALKHLGADHHKTNIARFDLSLVDAAEGNLVQATELQKQLHQKLGLTEGIHFHHRDTLTINFNIACSYCSLGRWEDAIREMEYLIGSIEFFKKEQYPQIFASLVTLAKMHEKYGKWENAQRVYEKLVENARDTRGDQSFYTIGSMSNLVEHYKKQSKSKEAAETQLKIVEISKEKHGIHHLDTQQRVLELAELYENQNRWIEANVLRQQAADALQDTFGPNNEKTLQAKSALCNSLQKRELFEKAAQVGQEVVLGYKTTLGEDHPKTLYAENQLALVINSMDRCAEAVKLQEKVLQTLERVHGEVHHEVGAALVNLAATYLRDGRFEDGEVLLKRALAINETIWGTESLQASACIGFLATAYVKAGRRQDSCKFHERALEIERKARGSNDAETLYLIRSLAYDYLETQQLEKAVGLQIEVLEGYRKLYGEQHKDVLQAMFDLGSSYHTFERFEEAEKLYQEALGGRRNLLGDSHDDTFIVIETLAILYADLERWENAKPLAHEMFTRSAEKYGNDHPKTREARSGLVTVYHYLSLWPQVEDLQHEVVEVSKRTLGVDHPETIDAMEILAEACENQGKYNLCEDLYVAVLEHRRQTVGTDDEATLRVMDNLANTFVENKKFNEAQELKLEALEAYRKTTGEDSEAYIDAKSMIANIYVYQKRFTEAEPIQLEVVEARIQTLGEDDASTLEAMESLAQNYFIQDRLTEAEELHLLVLTGRKNRGCSHLDPDVLISMKYLEDVCCKQLRWSDAKKYAIKLLEAMQELAPKNDGRGILSALADLRRIYWKLGEKDLVGDLEPQRGYVEASALVEPTRFSRR